MRILITGAAGQLGRCLMRALTDHDLLPVTRDDFDLTDPELDARIVALKPDLVIHAAACTQVDYCAEHPDEAGRINTEATANIARICARIGARMVYISTNEVFSGNSEKPYREADPTGAVNAYGASKREGEVEAAAQLEALTIVRTAWLYSRHGTFFPQKMLALADQLNELKVVEDEVSNPTYAPDLAEAIARLIETEAPGIFHLVNEGYCSRYTFAREILNRAGRPDYPVLPIPSKAFLRRSTPPLFCPLRNVRAAERGIQLRPWEEALDAFFEEE